MIKQIKLVEEFHEKFKTPILDKPQIPSKDRFEFRHKIMKSEVEEYLKGSEKQDLQNVAKELADILYTVYGTILEHGLQDIIEDIFQEVHTSNMSKDYHEFKMVKGNNFKEADVSQFFL